MLRRRLASIDPRDYVLLSRGSLEPWGTDASDTLPAPRHGLAAPGAFPGPLRRLSTALFPFYVARRALEIARVVRRERIEAVLACTGDLHDLPAAFLASRMTGARFHAYLFDDYVLQWPPNFERRYAALAAGPVLRGADSVIVPNEYLRDEIRARYDVDSVIVRNSLDMDTSIAPPSNLAPSRTIVYTGSVYHANYDAFRRLVSAIDGMPEPRPELHIHSYDQPERLRANGIAGRVTIHPHASAARTRDIQRSAGALFLPLGFDTPIPELIRTSAPGKLAEYLASGRPILVHAPQDSFIAWYFRTYDCGVVVDESGIGAIQDAVARVLDPAQTRALVDRARRRAEVDFLPRAADEAFHAALEGDAE